MRIPIDLIIHPQYYTFQIAELDTPVQTRSWKNCLWHMIKSTGATPNWDLESDDSESPEIDWDAWLAQKYLGRIALFRQVALSYIHGRWIISVDHAPVGQVSEDTSPASKLEILGTALFSPAGLDYAFSTRNDLFNH